MGLNAFLYKRKIEESQEENNIELVYWRKHNALQDFIHYNIHDIYNNEEFEVGPDELQKIIDFSFSELQQGANWILSLEDIIALDESKINLYELSLFEYQNVITIREVDIVLNHTDFNTEKVYYYSNW